MFFFVLSLFLSQTAKSDASYRFSDFKGRPPIHVFGGTSTGAPQWSAIKALWLSADNQKFYADKAGASAKSFFRDITSGTNGDCGYLCNAREHYDFVTGLDSPLTAKF